MTIATDIASITSYETTVDIPAAVVEATKYCTQWSMDDDELIKTVAIWILERWAEEKAQKTDPTVIVRPITELIDLLERLGTAESDTSTDSVITINTSPTSRDLGAWFTV